MPNERMQLTGPQLKNKPTPYSQSLLTPKWCEFVSLCYGTLVFAFAHGNNDANSPKCTHAEALPFYSHNKVLVLLHFKNLDQYPDYDFYVKYGPEPSTLERVGPGSSAQLFRWGTTLGTACLVAVPRGKVIQEPSQFKAGPNWVQDKLSGTLQSTQFKVEDTVLTEHHNECEVSYRIRISGEDLLVEFVELRRPQKKLSRLVVPVGIALALAGL